MQKKRMPQKWEGERERARMLQGLGGSRAIKHWSGRDNMCGELCSPSMACDIQEGVLGVCEEDAGQGGRPRLRLRGPQ